MGFTECNGDVDKKERHIRPAVFEDGADE